MFRLLCLVGLVLCGSLGSARAQTLKDSLKDHVSESLEQEQEKKKRRDKQREQDKAPRQAAPSPKGDKDADEPSPQRKPTRGKDGEAKDGTTLFAFSTEDGPEKAEPEDKPKGPKLPVRVIGKNLRLDFELGVGLRGWVPQQYDAVDVDTRLYTTWTIDVKAKLFKLINLRRGYYESNGVSGPNTEEAAVAAQIGGFVPKAVWVLGTIGVPITKAWEPVIRYETRAFETRAKPSEGVCVVDRDAPQDAMDCPGTMDDLKIISGFETFVAGIRYDHSQDSSPVIGEKTKKTTIPPFYLGVGLMQYRKPYQLTIGSQVLDDYLFDSRFRGAGLAAGTELGGGLDRFYSEIDVQVGLGEVSLTEDITLNEILSETSVSGDLLIGYFQGEASLSYRWPLIRAAPTLILVPSIKVGGASFFLIDTQVDEDEETESATVNWDFLWSARLSLIIPL